MDEKAVQPYNLELVLYQPQGATSPATSYLDDPQWSQCRHVIERLYKQGIEKQRILRVLEREHDFEPTYVAMQYCYYRTRAGLLQLPRTDNGPPKVEVEERQTTPCCCECARPISNRLPTH